MRVVVEDDDVHLTADVQGVGSLIVYHPSFARWGRDLAPVRDALVEAGHRVAMFDPRGVGESTGPLEGVTMHNLAADLLRVARSLGSPPYRFIGHAFGNRVARCAAADAPDEVDRIALLAAGGAIEGKREAYAALQRSMDLTLSIDERTAALRASLFAPQNDPSTWLDGWHPRAAIAQTAARATPIAEWADAGRARLLVIQGLDDALAPPENGRQLVARLGARRASLIELPDAGHVLDPRTTRRHHRRINQIFRITVFGEENGSSSSGFW